MNTFKTMMLMVLLSVLLMIVGDVAGGSSGATMMLGVSLLMNLGTYWFSDKLVLRAYNAQEISRNQAPELFGLVEKLTERADMPMPKVYIIPSEVPNAFATGRSPSHAAVAVTTGIMKALNYNELGGVLAHELSHIKHRDTLTATIVASMASVISWMAHMLQWGMIFGGGRSSDDDRAASWLVILFAPLAAMLIQMGISRSREYDADKSGGEICGNPLHLAKALEKIDFLAKNMRAMPDATPATAHLFIINPLKNVGETMASLFSTHPATADRIARLQEQAKRLNLRG